MSGARSYHAGLAAEGIVERHYTARGYTCLERRWRSPAGEIDLIFAGPGGLVFVEVKAARSIDIALASLGTRQIARICAAAEAFEAAPEMLGQCDPCMRRIDLAAVDGSGGVQIVENITL